MTVLELNGVDMRNIRNQSPELLAYRRRSQQRRESENNLSVEEAGTVAAVTADIPDNVKLRWLAECKFARWPNPLIVSETSI